MPICGVLQRHMVRVSVLLLYKIHISLSVFFNVRFSEPDNDWESQQRKRINIRVLCEDMSGRILFEIYAASRAFEPRSDALRYTANPERIIASSKQTRDLGMF